MRLAVDQENYVRFIKSGPLIIGYKMAKKVKLPKERNAAVMQLIKRAGAGTGVHGKSKKAQRLADKQQLRKQLNQI